MKTYDDAGLIPVEPAAPSLDIVLADNRHSKEWRLETLEELPLTHSDRVDFGFTHYARFRSGVWEIRSQADGHYIAGGANAIADYFYRPSTGWELGAN